MPPVIERVHVVETTLKTFERRRARACVDIENRAVERAGQELERARIASGKRVAEPLGVSGERVLFGRQVGRLR